jgi:hypothetical protein
MSENKRIKANEISQKLIENVLALIANNVNESARERVKKVGAQARQLSKSHKERINSTVYGNMQRQAYKEFVQLLSQHDLRKKSKKPTAYNKKRLFNELMLEDGMSYFEARRVVRNLDEAEPKILYNVKNGEHFLATVSRDINDQILRTQHQINTLNNLIAKKVVRTTHDENRRKLMEITMEKLKKEIKKAVARKQLLEIYHNLRHNEFKEIANKIVKKKLNGVK